ncbi:hypothetical protein [Formosa algae]|uniref:PEGA domain-containing protein n=1 Tax=Formosa algae TaxID=225843 RepID=A0A9X1CAE2_9FLAO|nr:hypothetical protein [Formosa algae]MBP1841743.1 hypothetical protein [Formosa algae]MDQ0337212.1 hypothetical protein [Formosa algae]OEI81962.1 hypothetical protein AST99_01405 [Formosa algae]PNW26408.1 hypothetical protein BKP44_17290 [Formosa algae]
MRKIRVERNSEWNNKARAIGIYIDGEKVGTINDGETQEYELENGKHEIFAKIDWCSSPKIELNIAQNESKTIKLSGFKYSKWIFPALLGIMLFYYLGNYALNIDLNFLIWIFGIGFLYPLYYITFGKNRYLIFTEKEDKNVLKQTI